MGTDCSKMYEFVKGLCGTYDAIHEEYLVRLIGEKGIKLLERDGLLECCGAINGQKLYALL